MVNEICVIVINHASNLLMKYKPEGAKRTRARFIFH